VLREAHLQRLERAVAPHLRGGWTRAVFAAPQQGGDPRDEQVHPGPGSGVAPTREQLAALFTAARAAANAGLIKQTYVLDDRRRVQVDARHGRTAVRTLDEDTARKVMGGKDRALRPDTSSALLRAIGIMNSDGTISANHARKYKQVNHLAELCRPTWERLLAARPRTPDDPLRVLDLACGNAYLSFILAESLRLAGVPLRLHGVDVRDDLVARSRERAATLEMPHLDFARATIAEAAATAVTDLGGPPDIVLALHACDTATDEALALAISLGVPAVLSVPCCQHELAAQLAARAGPVVDPLIEAADDPRPARPALMRHGLLRGAYADLLTDSLRVELLEACGYDVTVVEFVASEHTSKNILLRAHRRHPGARVDRARWRLAPIQARCDQLGVSPDLLRRLTALAAPT
jgi:SAM-dependent methyltransferase